MRDGFGEKAVGRQGMFFAMQRLTPSRWDLCVIRALALQGEPMFYMADATLMRVNSPASLLNESHRFRQRGYKPS